MIEWHIGLSPHTLPLQHPLDLAQNRRVVDGRRHGPGIAVGDFLDGAAGTQPIPPLRARNAIRGDRAARRARWHRRGHRRR